MITVNLYIYYIVYKYTKILHEKYKNVYDNKLINKMQYKRNSLNYEYKTFSYI